MREWRLRADITQQVLADRSGVSLNAVRHLEDGSGATLGTFVQVCRSLGRDRWILDLENFPEVSPIAFAEAMEKVRNGENPVLTTHEKHTRECFVVAKPDADKERVTAAMKALGEI